MTHQANSPSTSSDDGVSRFVVLFEGRSGSTYLVEALDSHPDIRAEREEFARLAKQVKDRDAEPSIQVEWAREFYSTESCAGSRAVGFKTKWKDILEPEAFASFLRESGIRVILLHRRNRIKLLVSLFRAMRLEEETGDWNLYDERSRQAPITIDARAFAERLAATEGRHDALLSYAGGLGVPTLELYYEELLGNEQAVFDRVCRFLSVPYRPLAGNTRKHTSDDLRDAVVNFEALRSAYVGTPFEAMFDERLVETPVE